jgi:hypothetical protein
MHLISKYLSQLRRIHNNMKKNYAILSIKILFILTSFALILWKADVSKIFGYIKNTNPLYLFAAYLIMSLAQITSAYRMRFYFAGAGVELGRRFSIGLYFTAMLFNTVLPGGIGGDGYKIYTIGKLAKFSRLLALKLALSERASGLFALLFLTVIFYFFAKFPEIIPHQNVIIIVLNILLIPLYFISIAVLLKEKPLTAIISQAYSIPIQLLNAAIAFTLLIPLGINNSFDITMSYMVLFMLSSVASIAPVSIGGAGLRELTFFYGAKLTGLNAELGVALAILFFIINILCSLNGLIFWHRLDKLYKASA